LVAANRLQTNLVLEPGSFRDWDSRVFVARDVVVRALTETGAADWEALSRSDVFREFTATGELVATTPADADVLEEVQRVDASGGWKAALVHERIPFVSYPYEWSFSMLKDAAMLQLRLLSASLREGLTLKDATPYNIQWRGARPVFVDVGSFERARDGEPWVGYRQFCMLFLYPLMLESYRRAPFQPWLRGSIDGISPTDFRSICTRRDMFRRGALRHVFLHASLEARYATRGGEVRSELSDAGFDRRLVEANVTAMTKLVSRLDVRRSSSEWTDYRSTCTYDDAETARKDEFVRRVVDTRRRALVWDLGCNDGRYSRIASSGAQRVVAFDSDRHVVDALYAALRADGDETILPLVVDLSNPSPALGWRNAERATLIERGAPDLVLALALVHHLSISGNVPLREVVHWLRGLDCEVIVEFPHRDDPMVQRLLGAKRDDAHPDYSSETFQVLLDSHFRIADRLELPSGTRTLYRVLPT
jgi:hypothetical protein